MAKEKGNTGLTVFNGIIQEEFLKELRGKEGYKRLDEMRRNNPYISGMLYFNEQAIRKVSWNFVNKADRKGTDPRVDFLNECREYMTQSWNDAISEWLSFVWAGYSLSFVNRKRLKDGRLGWDSFSPRKQATVYRWLLNYPSEALYDANRRSGEIMGFIQQSPPTYEMIEISINDVIHFRTRVESNNPEGVSMLRGAWVPYYYAKNYQNTEAIGFERDLNGMPHISMPQGASTDTTNLSSDASKAAEMVRNIRVDEQGGVVTPFGWEFELLSGSGKGFDSIGNAIKRLNDAMLTATLSNFITMGTGEVGSYGLSKDKTSIAEMIVNSTADIIAETFTKQEIPRILKLNGWDADGICMEHTPAGDTDLVLMADFLQKVGDKITTTPQDELWLRQLAGMPELTVEEINAAQKEKRDNAPTFGKPGQRPAMGKGKPMENMPADKPIDNEQPEDNTATLFGVGEPIDKWARTRATNAWDAAMTLFFEKQMKRVMKAAKEMKGL